MVLLLLPVLLLVGGVAGGCDVLLVLSLAGVVLFTAAVARLEVVLLVVAADGALPLPLAREERAEATAAEAAWARPPARLPLIAPIMGGGGGAGIKVAGSMLQEIQCLYFILKLLYYCKTEMNQ